ncbi:MAG: V-type ATP synthase subunit A, partial [Parachlamydiaceae bacterium]|nr:V-type ATP synthase subunit A [Parachlamydiaceae bacterium]
RILFLSSEIGKRMEVVGEEGIAMDDMVTFLKGELYDFCYLQQNAFDKEDAYCPLKRQIPLFQLINRIFVKDFDFQTHDAARQFFLTLQNTIKNLNLIPFDSEAYRKAFTHIEELIK